MRKTKRRWIDQIKEDLQARGVEWTTIMNDECWEDRYIWKHSGGGGGGGGGRRRRRKRRRWTS